MRLPFKARPAGVKRFGSSSWQSYAFFRAGVRVDEQGRFASARRLYHAALDADPTNRGARLNLARLEARLQHTVLALELCKQVRKESEKDWSLAQDISWQDSYKSWLGKAASRLRHRIDRHRRPPRPNAPRPQPEPLRCSRIDNVWYQARYQVAVFSYYGATEIELKRKKWQNPDGPNTAMKLAEELRTLVGRLDQHKGNGSTSAQIENLDTSAERVRMQLLRNAVKSCQVLMKTIESTYEILKPQARRRGWDAFPSLREQEPKIEQDRQLWLYLKPFTPSVRPIYAACLVVTGDYTGAAAQVSELKGPDLSHHRVQYNLACYESVRGLASQSDPGARRAAYHKALLHLEQSLALAPRILIEWALTDLFLRGVREDSEFKAAFAKLFKHHLGQVPTPLIWSLSDLTGVGEVVAQRLQDRGIRTILDFCERAQSADWRKALATELDVDPELVLGWALLADLIRVLGIDVQVANLLAVTGVSSVHVLKAKDPGELKTRLNDMNAIDVYVDALPTDETIERWVKQAGAATALVSES